MPYSVCGCDLDPDLNTSGHRSSQFVSNILHKEATPRTIDNPRPERISLANEDGNAAHPPEHNVDVRNPSGEAPKRTVMDRGIEAESGHHNAEKPSVNPKHDPWVGLQVEQNQMRTKGGHTEAFTGPPIGAGAHYPYWGVSMIPAFG